MQPGTKIEDSWIGFLIFSYFSQPTKPTNHLFFCCCLRTYLSCIHCEWQLWGLPPLDQHLLVVEHLNGCVYCDSASTPGRRQHCLQQRTVVGNTTYFQRWLYLQRMIENHKGSFTGWFELTLMSHFQVDYGWFSIYLFKVMFKRKICTIYFPGGKSWEWQSVLPWQLPFYVSILPHPRVCAATKSADKKSHCATMVPEYNCFSQTHIIPQSRNIQASRELT